MPSSETFNPQGQAVLKWGTATQTLLQNVEYSASTGDIDVTNNDSPPGVGEKTVGKRDMGSYAFDFICNSTNAAALKTDFRARTIKAFDFLYWTGGVRDQGHGFISDFKITAKLDGDSVVTGSGTITVTDETAPVSVANPNAAKPKVEEMPKEEVVAK